MKNKFQDIQDLSLESLQQEVVTCRKAIFHLRLQKRADASAVKPHHIRFQRRKIAQLKTALQYHTNKAPLQKKASSKNSKG